MPKNMKANKLTKVWDKHSKSLDYSDPTLENLKKSDNYIHKWALEIKNKKQKRLLDAGCGIGQYISETRLMGFKSEGVDISPESVRLGRKRGEKIILGDMRNLPYKKDTFDIIIAGGSIEHFPETEKGISELCRVLKKGGIFLMNVPYKYTIYVLNKKIQQSLGIWKCGYEKSFSIGGMKNLLENAGFRIVDVKKSYIGGGSRHPLLHKLLRAVDKSSWICGIGGHHIFFKCVRVK